ncbi:PH domain-containing protein [Actinomadura kijaniata]|uniref:PH domain-containing protein n=1 Tax=Actinomadura kijaniata TaxID=46161 RepID=UPI00082E30E0|nr:PH domain-containing protein [Actinomadura kijaniata]
MVLRVTPGRAAEWLVFAALFVLWGAYDFATGGNGAALVISDVALVTAFVTMYFLDRRRGITVTAEGLRIQGYLRAEQVEWSRVSHLEPRDTNSQRRVRLHLTDGAMRNLPAPQDGRGPLQRDRAFDEKAARLKAKVAEHTAGEPQPAP